MAVSFNGTTKIIVIDPGVTSLNVQDVYSEWKQWVYDGNSEFPSAFRSVGGDELQSDYFLSPTFFLLNGWRIRPDESNQTLFVRGNLYVDGSEDSPFISTIGNYNVRINSTTSNIVNTVATGSGVTSQDKTDIIDGIGTALNSQKNDILSDVQDKIDSQSESIHNELVILKGLVHHNFRMLDHVYDEKGNLTEATVRIYESAYECNISGTYLHEYKMYATFNDKKQLISYRMVAHY